MRRSFSYAWDQASPSRSPPRLPLQVSGPEQKTQQLPLLFPHEPKHIARSQALCRFARIGLHAPSQKFTPPRRQPMPARRIPKKPYRSKQTLSPPSECKSPPRPPASPPFPKICSQRRSNEGRGGVALLSDPTLKVILVCDCLIAMSAFASSNKLRLPGDCAGRFEEGGIWFMRLLMERTGRRT